MPRWFSTPRWLVYISMHEGRVDAMESEAMFPRLYLWYFGSHLVIASAIGTSSPFQSSITVAVRSSTWKATGKLSLTRWFVPATRRVKWTAVIETVESPPCERSTVDTFLLEPQAGEWLRSGGETWCLHRHQEVLGLDLRTYFPSRTRPINKHCVKFLTAHTCRTTMSVVTKLCRTSNFIGSCQHEALLF